MLRIEFIIIILPCLNCCFTRGTYYKSDFSLSSGIYGFIINSGHPSTRWYWTSRDSTALFFCTPFHSYGNERLCRKREVVWGRKPKLGWGWHERKMYRAKFISSKIPSLFRLTEIVEVHPFYTEYCKNYFINRVKDKDISKSG